MIISEKQIMQLIEIARTVLDEIKDRKNESYMFIADLLIDIQAQQSEELKEVK